MTSMYNYIGGYYDYDNDTLINLKNSNSVSFILLNLRR